MLDLPRALAGARTITGPVPPVFSPWDVAWWDGRIAVAAAGVHLLVDRHRAPRRDHGRGPARRPGAGRLAGPAERAGRGRRHAVVRRCRDVVAADPARRHAGDRGRRGPVRLRPGRRAGRAGTLPAPARRDAAAGRHGRGARHVQRGGPALRPGDPNRRHAGPRSGRADRRGGAGRRARRGRVGRAPAHPDPAAPDRRRRARARSPSRSRSSRRPGETLDDRYGPATSLTAHRPGRRRQPGSRADPADPRRDRAPAARQRVRGQLRRGTPSTRPATWPGGTGTCGWCRTARPASS